MSNSGEAMMEYPDHPPANGRVHPDFPPKPEELLARPLDPSLVSLRPGNEGRMVPYVEGYQVINQANRIFGYGKWGSEIIGPLGFRQDTANADSSAAAGIYWARVRVRVSGYGSHSDVGCGVVAAPSVDGHELAIKAAVTDGMKRALRQFGDQFGNALYDRSDPARLSAERELADLRAVVFVLGELLGLDEADTRLRISQRSGRSFEQTGVTELASVLRSMTKALANRRETAA